MNILNTHRYLLQSIPLFVTYPEIGKSNLSDICFIEFIETVCEITIDYGQS
ncbi:MAG: hypothetical protein ACI845_002905 [Gammaproteobacteria bacterium]|jgi:hypothetical protein